MNQRIDAVGSGNGCVRIVVQRRPMPWLGIHCVAIAMLAGMPAESWSVEPQAAEHGVSRPPKLQNVSSEELGRCYAPAARRSGGEGSIEVFATIERDGSIGQVTLPPGIEPWQEETAQCVMGLLRFDAALTNGVPTQSNIVIPLKFNLTDEPVIVPPRIQAWSREEVGKCYSRYARRTGQEGRLLVTVTVEADGRLGEIELPSGIEFWQEETARCVLGIVKFLPGTKDGVAVTAQAKLPLNFSLIGSAPIEYLKLISTPAEIEDANRTCYPPDSLAIAQPQYRVTVNRAGKAKKISIVESTGDGKLDEAGICMLKLLRFQPAMRGKEAVDSTAVLPVPLTPPK